jgi:hypothetical protein
MITMTDVTIINEGTLVGFQLNTKAARDWFAANVGAEGWQWMGTTLWVDHRYAHPLAEGIDSSDLTLEVA